MHNKSAYKTELELIEGLKKNEDFALKEIYSQNYSIISQFIMNNSGSIQEAKDIFQDAIIVFYKNVNDINFKLDCKIRTYIYSVARRLWLNELKAKGRRGGDISDYENFLIFNDKQENDFLLKEKQINIMSESMEILGEPCSTILNDFYINIMSNYFPVLQNIQKHQ